MLGVLLLLCIGLYAACGGGSDKEPRKTAGSPTPTSPAAPASQSPDAGQPVLTPESGGPSGGDAGTSGPDGTEAVPPPQGPGGDTSPCADGEIAITPVPAKATITRQTPVDLRLIVQNSSNRSCSRDVGADLQELRIVQGAQTVWSSDTCGPAHGSDVRTLAPGGKLEYMVTWNGRSSAKCSSGVPAGAAPAAGQYHLLGRVGTKLSSPVVLTIR